MLPFEPIRDPNVAAYLAYHGGMAVLVWAPEPVPWWWRLAVAAGLAIAPEPPAVGPDECRRDGGALIMGTQFYERMAEHVRHYAIQAEHRLEIRRAGLDECAQDIAASH